MRYLKEDLKEFGIKLEGWREAAQKTGRWFRRVEEGAEVFMREWHNIKDEKEASAERHRTAATATKPLTPRAQNGREEEGAKGGRGGRGDEGGRGGTRGGEGGGGLLNRLTPGYGDHRHDALPYLGPK